ncbi:MAG: HEAT repeat domain-containing protein [Nitrospirales bacterium]|nr:HEAT repeat domain-containing protein [Nitrospirales bacterium]
MIKRWTYLILFFIVLLVTTDSFARRSHVTPEQKTQLQQATTIYVKTIALTEDGRVDATPLTAIIQTRLEEIGYSVVTNRKEPHDVVFQVKCEERKRWAGTTRSGGDAELADAPSRLWKGPACLFSYRLQGKDLGWYKEVRTSFENATEAARNAKETNPGHYALQQLYLRLQIFDFPVLVSSEFGQTHRLFALLKSPETPKPRKLTILSVLENKKSTEALPYLLDLITRNEVGEAAIGALAGIGSPAIPHLIKFFKDSDDNVIKAAAAKGLGHIGAYTGDPTITPPLLDYLNESLEHMNQASDINFPVLTEVVVAIYKLRNEESIRPIEILNEKIWLIHDNSPEMKRLRDEANVATKMVDLDYQIM